MKLQAFNSLPVEHAEALLRSCVNISSWATAVIQQRPFSSIASAMACAQSATEHWQPAEIAQALAEHPRIGERKPGTSKDAQLSQQEQAGVDITQQAVVDELAEGNRRYEARFGQVFLIRAKGRSASEILSILRHRLTHTVEQEQRETTEQLREITLLRFEELFNS